ncbi:MAG: hypothetical protein ACK5G7_02840 [Erysipelotrichaceae bacterium]
MKFNKKKYHQHLYKRFRGLCLIIFLLAFCSFPLLSLTLNVANQISYQIIAVGYLLLAFSLPLFCFRFNYYSNASDFYYALPLDRQDLFNNSFLLGYLVASVPISLATIIGIITEVLINNALLLPLLLEYLNIIFFFSVIYTLVVMIIQYCNNVIDTIISTIGLINLPFILAYLVLQYVNTITGSITVDQGLMALLSPVYNLLYFYNISANIFIYLIYFVVLLLALYFASKTFYQKANHNYQKITTHHFKTIIKYLLVMCAFFAASIIGKNNFNNSLLQISFAFIISFVTYLITVYVNNRSLKFSFNILIKFILLMIVLVAFIILIPILL